MQTAWDDVLTASTLCTWTHVGIGTAGSYAIDSPDLDPAILNPDGLTYLGFVTSRDQAGSPPANLYPSSAEEMAYLYQPHITVEYTPAP
jgi:hypothetical protein